MIARKSIIIATTNNPIISIFKLQQMLDVDMLYMFAEQIQHEERRFENFGEIFSIEYKSFYKVAP